MAGTPVDDSLVMYFSEISNSQPLSRAEEVELARRTRTGDNEARNELVQANLPFVVSVAKRYRNRGLTLPELISAGNVGLMAASERFDGERGFKFISYAVWWIRQAILAALADQGRTVRLPLNKVSLLNDIHNAMRRSDQSGGEGTDVGAVASVLQMSPEQVEEVLLSGQPICSLDEPLAEGESLNLCTVLADITEEPPDAGLWRQLDVDQLRSVLANLTSRERKVLDRYYGLDGGEPATLDKIGKQLGLTRERVRQIKKGAIDQLRQPGRACELPSELVRA